MNADGGRENKYDMERRLSRQEVPNDSMRKVVEKQNAYGLSFPNVEETANKVNS